MGAGGAQAAVAGDLHDAVERAVNAHRLDTISVPEDHHFHMRCLYGHLPPVSFSMKIFLSRILPVMKESSFLMEMA